MSNHSSETDVILGPKADMERMYSLLKAIPDSFDYAGTMMKAFSGDPNYAAASKYTLAENGEKIYANDGYFDIERDVRLCNAELCDSSLAGLSLLSVSSLNFGGNGWDPILFMEANKIDYRKLVELGQGEYDPPAQYWFVRDNVANKEESTSLYDLEMLTHWGKKPLAPDDPRVTKKPSDFIQSGLDLFNLLR